MRHPRLLRLPRWLLRQGLRLDRALALDPAWTRARPGVVVPRLRLSGPEERFARELLQRRSNLWLWRCLPSASCGDFAVVDLSDPRPDARPLWLVELKERSPWRPGRGLQLQRPERARDELAGLGVIGAATTPVLAEASTDAALRQLGR